jgi:hypothetical protein
LIFACNTSQVPLSSSLIFYRYANKAAFYQYAAMLLQGNWWCAWEGLLLENSISIRIGPRDPGQLVLAMSLRLVGVGGDLFAIREFLIMAVVTCLSPLRLAFSSVLGIESSNRLYLLAAFLLQKQDFLTHPSSVADASNR